MILTDGLGRPIDKPEPPAPDAGIDAHIAFLRDHAAYRDKVADLANNAFTRAFQRTVKERTP